MNTAEKAIAEFLVFTGFSEKILTAFAALAVLFTGLCLCTGYIKENIL
jgi:hypothetical protein